MQRPSIPKTPAIRFLEERGTAFQVRLYSYEERGGTRRAAQELAVPEHQVIKTLVMESDGKRPLLVLMHGDLSVSTQRLARALGARRVTPCDPISAQKHTGYVVGGISPFGTRAALPVYVEKTVFALERILINGGRRGLLLEIDPRDLRQLLALVEVEVGVPA